MENNLDVDYKEIDRDLIIKYIKSKSGVISVENLIAESGANKLRIYPLLIELEQQGTIKVTKQDMFGAPVEIMAR